jgi:glycosyltransferase involved in cell wall biosynthesis
MNAPISVVIPAFNAAAYIDDTIKSIQAQTLQVTEIIVVNDGSTDDTSVIARACGATVIDQQNVGLPATRNRGIASARQPWIAFADADDPWELDKIERQWRSLQLAPNASFSFSDFSQFNVHGIINASVIHEVHRHFELVSRRPLDRHASLCDSVTLGAALLRQNVFCPSSLIVKRDVALSLGGYDPKLFAAEDYEFVLRLTRKHVGTYVDLPLVRYRRHGKAMTSNIPRMREGLVAVALRTITRPGEYAPQTSEHFSRELPYYFIKSGFAHIRYGDQRLAREWLERSLRQRFTFSGALLYALTFAVESSVGRLLRDRIVAVTCRGAFDSPKVLKHSAARDV